MRSSCILFLFAFPLLSQTFVWKDLGGGRLQLSEGGKPVLVYNYGPQLKPGAPENRRRCCYLFPVYTPAGVSVLDDFPEDHWHHRGLFWAWPVVEVDGHAYDLWMNMTVKDREPSPPVTRVTSDGAHLEAASVWEVEGKPVVREHVRLQVLPATDVTRDFDVELTWEATGSPVTLRGSREVSKSYGGFGARFAPREQTVLRADDETLSKDEDLTPRRWAELEGAYSGKKAALRITPDSKDLGVPYQWCLRNYGFVGASFPGRTAEQDGYTLQPGKPLTLKFRVQVRDVRH